MAARSELIYAEPDRIFLEPFLPSERSSDSLTIASLPWVTLTFATSLDSALSIAPGVQTALSGPESKAMTHYLRSRHDAILVGVGTAVADNPSLNCRLNGVGGYGGQGLDGQPRPVVIDPHGRWQLDSGTKILDLARQGRGKAPWIVTMVEPEPEKARLLEEVGGEFIVMGSISSSEQAGEIQWQAILQVIRSKGSESIMIEGGGGVINALLSPDNAGMVHSVIITIAPTWLGQGGVVISPPRPASQNTLPVARLKQTVWRQLGDDCVLCGNLKQDHSRQTEPCD
ncbi:riboflavin biosynthesis protein Rib7 [Delphinella strobiligena]|nr:riboflavin biosynthesis protein Rib7 [Delphinella strobiligena]